MSSTVCLEDPSDDPLLIMGQAIDLDWNIMRGGRPRVSGTTELRESHADEANKKYRKLSTYSAQRVMRFWQAREGVGREVGLIPLVRQHRQRVKLDAFLVQFLGVFGDRLAVDRAMLDLAVVHLAGVFRKLVADIVGVRGQVIAQLLQLGAEFLLLRRDHRDRLLGASSRRLDRRDGTDVLLVLAGNAAAP